MHKKCDINWTKIKGGCQSGRKVVTNNSKSDLPLAQEEEKCVLKMDRYSFRMFSVTKIALLLYIHIKKIIQKIQK